MYIGIFNKMLLYKVENKLTIILLVTPINGIIARNPISLFMFQ